MSLRLYYIIVIQYFKIFTMLFSLAALWKHFTFLLMKFSSTNLSYSIQLLLPIFQILLNLFPSSTYFLFILLLFCIRFFFCYFLVTSVIPLVPVLWTFASHLFIISSVWNFFLYSFWFVSFSLSIIIFLLDTFSCLLRLFIFKVVLTS